ncbi:DNA-binding transcriptional regulator, AcrR family [Lentibacillus persicus]|uniref:DNA-binding transcriptional regulator, AcrR family n=1 Tax=Lentibacillus persicus TaxID=640948 RepID=A0A1I1XSX9_9BACI|nr:TetR/AcrR family transcriptional regulator [Lentibacillus persicus]SFE10477.1 DNA-binding transcriptional regulator, AcrR family [Lentibacillus persicus]
MNAKKIELIEAGMKLFAEKGYHSTSVEAIALSAGVSKGAFYLHFQSKNDFAKTAFDYYHEAISKRVEAVQQEGLPPKESFAKQIETMTAYIYEHKNFIKMHLNQNISFDEDTDKLIQKMNAQNFRWLYQNVSSIYGNKAEPYYPDIIIQLEGLMNGYFKWIIIDEIMIDGNQLGAYIVRRLDDVVSGLIKRSETPLVTSDQIPAAVHTNRTPVQDILNTMTDKIDELGVPEDKEAELHALIEVMSGEIAKDDPKKAVMQGLLVHFQRRPEFEEECRELARLLQMELLE